MKRLARKLKSKIKTLSNRFKKIVPVCVPVYHNDLLSNRVALITGGTSGIGFEIARAFLRSGATVIITGRNLERVNVAINSLKDNKESLDDKVFGVELNNSNIHDFEEKFTEVKELLADKKLDILVNNAGILAGGTFSEVTPEDFDLVHDTNLKGVYFLSQIVSKYMVQNNIHGNILNIASSSSLRPASTPYILSKWGVRGFTLGLAKVLSPHQIIVNGLAPGPTATPMLVSEGKVDLSHNRIPSNRFATPEEIANFAVILVSDLSRTIIGDTIYMTGGAGNLTVDDIDYNF